MTTPIIITIPKYVTTTSSSSPMFKDYVDFKSQPENSVKGRKRRLDHLSWEEKLQRKKLKNRVAAQTSRDRKKQKMDEMEATLEELMEKNEKLMSECEKLQSLNKKLSTENGELRRKNTIGSCSEQTTHDHHHTEDPDDLSAVPDLLTDFDTELDIDKLEEFAQSLLEDITADMEAAAAERQTSSSGCQKDCTRKMVGSTSEHVESGRNVSEIEPVTGCLDIDMSDQQQMSKITSSSPSNNPETEQIIYTTLTDTAGHDCITIIVSDGNDVPIGEVETEIVTTEPEQPNGGSGNLAEFVSSYRVSEEDAEEEDVCGESLSPAVKSERALSDCGYESFGSPHSEYSDVAMSELWNQDVSELFPNLM
ncbi:X box binding protein-1 [Carabus blaptoides fortunei]